MRPVNLLPEQHRRSQGPADGRGGQVFLGVLGALVVMAALYAVFTNQVNSKKTNAAEARAEAKQLSAKVDALGEFGDFAQIKQNRLASVRSLADVRFDWERLMREVSRVVPRSSWLQEANASVTGELDSSSGSSSPSSSSSSSSSSPASSSSSATAGQPAANLVGCAPRQSEVAKLMVRLRRLYRATDVTLNESGQDEGTSGASLDSCGRYVKFDVTVAFGAPATTGEGPGERKNVPASLGGGS